jgi:hypothetical protein
MCHPWFGPPTVLICLHEPKCRSHGATSGKKTPIPSLTRRWQQRTAPPLRLTAPLGLSSPRYITWRRHTTQQSAYHSMPPRDLGHVRALFETLGDDPRLLFRRPPAPPTLPRDKLHPAYAPSSCLASSMAFAIAPPPTISLCQAVSQAIHAIARCDAHSDYVLSAVARGSKGSRVGAG